MNAIGGYFELEYKKGDGHYHDTPYALKSGRASLYHILSNVKPTSVYIPFYTCNALLRPFNDAGINYIFYGLNELLEPEITIELKEGEYFLYINYFDLKRDVVFQLSEKYKEKLIVDCSQAFFMKGNNSSWFFNSCRKFFGVPDGSYLYGPEGTNLSPVREKNEDYVVDHLLKRFNGHPREGYEFFLRNEILAGEGNSGISKLSEYLLADIDYEEVIMKRRENYIYLNNRLAQKNLFHASHSELSVPMYYPFLSDKSVDKAFLATKNIFIPSFWEDVTSRLIPGFDFEKEFANKLCPLPIDHRYTLSDMELICEELQAFA